MRVCARGMSGAQVMWGGVRERGAEGHAGSERVAAHIEVGGSTYSDERVRTSKRAA